MSKNKDYSEDTAILIDKEIKRIVDECYQKTLKTLKDNIDLLNELANILLEKETIDGKELDELVRKFKPELFTAEAVH